MSFENNIKRLEEIVNVLEDGQCDFEQATKLFEEGKDISVQCSKVLEDSKGKITELIKDLDRLVEVDI